MRLIFGVGAQSKSPISPYTSITFQNDLTGRGERAHQMRNEHTNRWVGQQKKPAATINTTNQRERRGHTKSKSLRNQTIICIYISLTLFGSLSFWIVRLEFCLWFYCYRSRNTYWFFNGINDFSLLFFFFLHP